MVWSWWTNKEVGHNQEARKEVIALFGDPHALMTSKPERLIKRIVLTGSESRSIVFDYFSGCGTTGHALINLNRQGGAIWSMAASGARVSTSWLSRAKPRAGWRHSTRATATLWPNTNSLKART
ncbi:MAG: DNA methyltransferase [Desulfobacterota bacterium U4-17]